MSFKQLWLPLKIENFVNVENKNGVWHCHIIIDEKYLKTLKSLQIYEKWEDVPADYKNENGGLLHEYCGFATSNMSKDNPAISIKVPIEEQDGYL